MSFLYKNRQKRSFQSQVSDSEASHQKSHDSDEDNDDADQFFKTGKGKTATRKKSNTTDKNTESSRDQPSSGVNLTGVNKISRESVEVDPEDDDVEKAVREEFLRMQQPHSSSQGEEGDLCPTLEHDSLSQSLLAMKKKISSDRQRIAKVSAANNACNTTMIDISAPMGCYIPKVKSAREREEEAAKILAQKNKLMQANTKIVAPSSSGSKLEFSDEEGSMIHIKTRLGSHEKQWYIPSNCNIGKLKNKISLLYNVLQTKLNIVFDGSILNDKDTIESAEIEEDDLLDVKVDKTLIPKAIDHAKTMLSSRELVSSLAPESSQEMVDKEEDLIMIQSRLGSHMKDWRVSIHSSFIKLKSRLATFYDLPQSKINIIFDGDTQSDHITLEDAGIEDGDLLDIKVDKQLINKAVDYATRSICNR